MKVVCLMWCFLFISTGKTELEQGSCMHEGQTYPNGTVISRNITVGFQCRETQCLNGFVAEHVQACSHGDCPSGYDKVPPTDSECCATCQPQKHTCTVNGSVYQDGTEISRSTDGCTITICSQGMPYANSQPDCVQSECGAGYRAGYVPGVCCPECIKDNNTVPEYGCLVNGTIYKDGDTISDDGSGCSRVECSRGDVVRAVATSCDPNLRCAGGKPPVKKTGICCPVCEGSTTKSPGSRAGCSSNGNQISVGEWVKSDACTPCQCESGGRFQCYEIACTRPKCSDATVPIGKCCPSCPGTRPEDVNEFPCIPNPCNRVSGPSHTCIMIDTSYQCMCDSGYLQASDKKSCIKDTSGSQQTVYTTYLLLIVPVLLTLNISVEI